MTTRRMDRARLERVMAFVRIGGGALALLESVVAPAPPSLLAAHLAAGGLLLLAGGVLAVYRWRPLVLADERVRGVIFTIDCLAMATFLLDYASPGDITWVAYFLVVLSAAARWEIRGALVAFALFVVSVVPVQVIAPAYTGYPPFQLGNRQAGNLIFEVGIMGLLAGFLGLIYRAQYRIEAQLKHTLADLEAASDERRKLLARVVTSQEEERRRIANDVHDDAVQVMTAVTVRLSLLRRHLSDNQQVEIAERLEEAVGTAIGRLRALLFALRPPALEREGISSALDSELDLLHRETGIQVELKVDIKEEPDQNLRTILYRVIQEALANVRKHSQALSVKVSVTEAKGGCHTTVIDDGRGFEAEGAVPEPGHLGLLGMRERVEIAGGWYRLESRPGNGTSVEFWLPLPPRSSGQSGS